jgi:hypothetical protein
MTNKFNKKSTWTHTYVYYTQLVFRQIEQHTLIIEIVFCNMYKLSTREGSESRDPNMPPMLCCMYMPGFICDCKKTLQVTLLLRDFVLHNFSLTWLQNSHNFLNLHDNLPFNAIWHRRPVAIVMFCRRLAGSNVTVTPSVVSMGYVGVISTRLI